MVKKAMMVQSGIQVTINNNHGSLQHPYIFKEAVSKVRDSLLFIAEQIRLRCKSNGTLIFMTFKIIIILICVLWCIPPLVFSSTTKAQ
jgi:hypothetical protein